MYRNQLLKILDAGLGAADGRRCVRDFLRVQQAVGAEHLIAIGKAAAPMALGALDVLGRQIQDGYVVTRSGYGDPELGAVAGIRQVESSHPVPDEASLRAGAGLMNYIAHTATDARVLVLISGGASSLVEVLPEGMSLEDLQQLNRWLLASGLDIHGINAIRRRVSRIKDGRLAAALQDRPVQALYLSDVKGDDPAWIGSGLLVPADTDLPGNLPDWVIALLDRHATPTIGATGTRHAIVGNLARAQDGCERAARAMGYRVTRHRPWLSGPAAEAARRIVTELDAGPAGIHLWGGETTVILPEGPGRGGRNQHLALCCALAIEDRTDLAVLCSATDGADGNTEDAGGLVDGGTIRRGRDGGADPVACLAGADSGSFLQAAGDLIHTGPTATNVNDLVIGWKGRPG